ncbi:hypothetical protein AG1IA_03768 [Rhizoctonia solani AG-1 IA]|uniref:Uncharacterized protein n=1 Tax=Thanatephorus cucumeris (strain AG1-IA) TaxID=983506 RepID=L8WZJ8_THACA|nr:hypothetical protein AG1IA_03768 [Rhizoctonia solani AG-1 IA]
MCTGLPVGTIGLRPFRAAVLLPFQNELQHTIRKEVEDIETGLLARFCCRESGGTKTTQEQLLAGPGSYLVLARLEECRALGLTLRDDQRQHRLEGNDRTWCACYLIRKPSKLTSGSPCERTSQAVKLRVITWTGLTTNENNVELIFDLGHANSDDPNKTEKKAIVCGPAETKWIRLKRSLPSVKNMLPTHPLGTSAHIGSIASHPEWECTRHRGMGGVD